MDKEVLESVGINYDEAVDRFAGSMDVFEKFLKEMATINVIDALQKKLIEKDVEGSFKLAHTLKGNFGNLSVIPLYNITSSIVDELKDGNIIEAQKLYIELEQSYKTVIDGIRKAM